MARQRTPRPPGPPSAARLDGALRYSADVARSRARSSRRPVLPDHELLLTSLEALARVKMASESLRAAVLHVGDVHRGVRPPGPAGLDGRLENAEEWLRAALSLVANAQMELERFLGRPTLTDGSAGVGDRKGAPGV